MTHLLTSDLENTGHLLADLAQTGFIGLPENVSQASCRREVPKSAVELAHQIHFTQDFIPRMVERLTR